MAAKQKQDDRKPPVQDAIFRMTVENTIARFIESNEEELAFAPVLTKAESTFVENYASQFNLKVKMTGKGKVAKQYK